MNYREYNLFVMKAVAPAGTAMGQVYAASIPFLFLDLVVMGLLLVFSGLILWIPGRN